jgi:hypothetical protein
MVCATNLNPFLKKVVAPTVHRGTSSKAKVDTTPGQMHGGGGQEAPHVITDPGHFRKTYL